MNDRSKPIEDLQYALGDALDLLRTYARDTPPSVPAEPLPSLLAQCEALGAAVLNPGPIRSVHHLACTGGTLMSKCLATMPNVTLLSEIDPLSRMQAPKHMFRPTDIIYGARQALRPVDDATVIKMFQASVRVLNESLARQGGILMLRDHAHSHFCTDVPSASRPSLHDILTDIGPVRSVATVRHPLDSFLSLTANGWRQFEPFTLEEYAMRYQDFLSRHSDIPVYRYEDFVRAPEPVLEQICADLDISYTLGSEGILEVVSMSGDSGRQSATISERPRRAVPEQIAAQVDDSPSYVTLCQELGYDPAVAPD